MDLYTLHERLFSGLDLYTMHERLFSGLDLYTMHEGEKIHALPRRIHHWSSRRVGQLVPITSRQKWKQRRQLRPPPPNCLNQRRRPQPLIATSYHWIFTRDAFDVLNSQRTLGAFDTVYVE